MDRARLPSDRIAWHAELTARPSALQALDNALRESDDGFETSDPARAVREFTGVYGPHSLELVDDADMDLCVRSRELARLHVARIRYGTQVHVGTPPRADPHWVFSYVRTGTVQRGRGRARAARLYEPGAAGMKEPDEAADILLSADTELVNLRVHDDDMRAACRSLVGAELADTLRFDEGVAAGSRPARLLTLVMKQLASAPRFEHPAARRYEASLRDTALYELLLGWPNSVAAAHAVEAPLPASTRRAREYIHAHASEVPSVADIAAAAGVGVRALGLGFEKHFGVSPLRYLQQVRLDGVHAELTAASLDDTVTRIAMDWGFVNLGAFAARYRERFGETPRQTLRRRLV
jgi:AraC-like DNA-binding protein